MVHIHGVAPTVRSLLRFHDEVVFLRHLPNMLQCFQWFQQERNCPLSTKNDKKEIRMRIRAF